MKNKIKENFRLFRPSCYFQKISDSHSNSFTKYKFQMLRLSWAWIVESSKDSKEKLILDVLKIWTYRRTSHLHWETITTSYKNIWSRNAKLIIKFIKYLTEAGAYPQLPTQPNFFWSFSNLYSNLLWSFWVVSRRKIKIWIWGKKVQFITESCILRQKRLQISLFSKKLNFFSSNSNFDFSSRDNSEWPY